MGSAQHDLHGAFLVPLTHDVRLLVGRSSDVEHDHHVGRSGSAGSLVRVVSLGELSLLHLREDVLQERLVLRVDAVVALDGLGDARDQSAQSAAAVEVARAALGGRESALELRFHSHLRNF